MRKVLLILFSLLIPFSYAETLQVTLEHPFLVDENWVDAGDLKVGDILNTIDGPQVIIKNITYVKDNTLVYNLEAGEYHDFVLADGLIVHNSNRPSCYPS